LTPNQPVTEERLPLAKLLAKSGDAEFLHRGAEAVLQMRMETDIAGLIGATSGVPASVKLAR
jgi:putative transposase